ncbi:MAG: hypothetical protein ACKPBA_15175, partial [Planctomycetota bacterium]
MKKCAVGAMLFGGTLGATAETADTTESMAWTETDAGPELKLSSTTTSVAYAPEAAVPTTNREQ